MEYGILKHSPESNLCRTYFRERLGRRSKRLILLWLWPTSKLRLASGSKSFHLLSTAIFLLPFRMVLATSANMSSDSGRFLLRRSRYLSALLVRDTSDNHGMADVGCQREYGYHQWSQQRRTVSLSLKSHLCLDGYLPFTTMKRGMRPGRKCGGSHLSNRRLRVAYGGSYCSYLLQNFQF